MDVVVNDQQSKRKLFFSRYVDCLFSYLADDWIRQRSVPTGGTAGAISLAIAISGEPVLSSQMISTPAAVGQYNNVSSGIYVDVPAGCCANIAVKNTSAQSINVANANLVVTREA